MSERAYTLAEIDMMRLYIKTATWRQQPAIEDDIRTMMVGGVDPQEVVDKYGRIIIGNALFGWWADEVWDHSGYSMKYVPRGARIPATDGAKNSD